MLFYPIICEKRDYGRDTRSMYGGNVKVSHQIFALPTFLTLSKCELMVMFM